MARLRVAPLVLFSAWSPSFQNCGSGFGCGRDEPYESRPEEGEDAGPECDDSAPERSVGPEVFSSAPASPENLFPLGVGSVWTYDVILDDPCAPNPCKTAPVSTILSQTRFSDRDAVQSQGACMSEVTHYSLTPTGIEQAAADGSGWISVVHAPIEEGFTWHVGEFEFVWVHAQNVEAPAGRFHDCWLRYAMPATAPDTTFCPGVGIVRSVRKGYTLFLRSYELKP